MGDSLFIGHSFRKYHKGGASTYASQNPERRMLKIRAKGHLKLHMLPPEFDASNGETALCALSGDPNETVQQ